MKLTLVIPALTAGGAERVMTILANEWAERGHHVALLTLDDGASPPFFALNPAVRHRPLGILADSRHCLQALTNNLGRVSILRRALREEQPDVVISFLDSTNVLVLLASRGLGPPVIVSEHIDTGLHRLKPVWNVLRRCVYPWADQIVVLTERSKDGFPPALRSRMAVIPNPVLPPAIGFDKRPPLPTGPRLVAMGRLVPQKGFDILLEAFAKLSPRFPRWTLLIIGEGPERQALESQCQRHGLSGKVLLPGLEPKPSAILVQADLFVLSSRFEGFPMALCEAMACGLASVATDCPTGPREILREGMDGLLVPPDDVEALAAALVRLMADDAERQRMAQNAPSIIERFGPGRVMALWEEVIAKARTAKRG